MSIETKVSGVYWHVLTIRYSFCITFITKAFDDAKLLRVGYAFEQITKVRMNGPKPFKVPQTELKDVLQKS